MRATSPFRRVNAGFAGNETGLKDYLPSDAQASCCFLVNQIEPRASKALTVLGMSVAVAPPLLRYFVKNSNLFR